MEPGDQLFSINPATEEVLRTYDAHSSEQIDEALKRAERRFRDWSRTPYQERSRLMHKVAAYLRQHRARFASIVTAEMGKLIAESEAEIDKCAWNCDFYADNAERYLQPERRETSATESYIQYTPLGVILAIMPWNFPFWQVFRFAAPALMAGNTAILKHASNVPQCALAIDEVFQNSGFPAGAFTVVLTPGRAVSALIEHPAIAAVTLTGSDAAGAQVAAHSGKLLKKTVLELGGSDPFIVLEDADIGAAAEMAVRARYFNNGQSCINSKRFIVLDPVYRDFERRFVEGVRKLKVGDPADRSTQVGPLARPDLLDDLERQVRQSLDQGARLLYGGKRRPGRGYYFEPSVLADVRADMIAGSEEVFGPVAALMRVKDEEEAVRTANSSQYGLGASIWTTDIGRAKRLARHIEAGSVFINGLVASDPRLPFGGIKRSGYGRELSEFGIREMVNVQTVWIGPLR
jgi:acyl-CoA reductase-like NAD-dependent aldehyde dehydrogenase